MAIATATTRIRVTEDTSVFPPSPILQLFAAALDAFAEFIARERDLVGVDAWDPAFRGWLADAETAQDRLSDLQHALVGGTAPAAGGSAAEARGLRAAGHTRRGAARGGRASAPRGPREDLVLPAPTKLRCKPAGEPDAGSGTEALRGLPHPRSRRPRRRGRGAQPFALIAIS